LLTYLKALHVVPDRPCIKQWVAQWTFEIATLVYQQFMVLDLKDKIFKNNI